MNVEPVNHGYYNASQFAIRTTLYCPVSIRITSFCTTGDCQSAYHVTASIAAPYLLDRFATCSSTASGGSWTSSPYYILLNPRPIASPKLFLVPSALHPAIFEMFRVSHGKWL